MKKCKKTHWDCKYMQEKEKSALNDNFLLQNQDAIKIIKYKINIVMMIPLINFRSILRQHIGGRYNLLTKIEVMIIQKRSPFNISCINCWHKTYKLLTAVKKLPFPTSKTFQKQ